MSDFLQIASGVLSQSVRRAEIAAHNITNASTPGYRAQVSFSELLNGSVDALPHMGISRQDGSGALMETGSPTDLAILGEGYFVLDGPDGPVFTRAGQFERGADGRLIGLGGLPLQAETGGDVVLAEGAFEVLTDGVVLQQGAPVARLAIVAFEDPTRLEADGSGGFRASDGTFEPVADRAVRQGALEASNVTLATEMMVLMDAVRRAETGQRLVSVYDDLMGRAIGSFSQGG